MDPIPSPVSTLSHYRLIELIGRGAMGEVWLAEDTQLPRSVAVKLLPAHLAEDRDAVDRLLREAQAAASIDHPAVVAVYEAGVFEGRPYLVMPRVEGETLEARLARGPLPVIEAVEIATRIADALAEVHALGIVHRDLKPSNIMLTARGPKVLDFGVAAVKGSPRLTATGVALGTPLAMSPEQLRGSPPDNRSDLWALGCMIYEMLTGRQPFAGDDFASVAARVLNQQPPAPSAQRAEVGADLDYLVMKLLRKDAAHRYARAEDLLADLDNCCAAFRVAPAPAAHSTPRIAVLYFDVMSAEPDDAFVAAGLAEDLIVDLTRVQGLSVSSRAEVLPYRDRPLPPRTLARELGVDYIVHGSVRRAGARARISAQLVRASDGHALWADRFDRTLDDLFEVQAEVSRSIVDALQVALKPGEREMLDRAPTSSAEAYGFYLRARPLISTSRDDSRRAEQFLHRALELDPNFALAHAALGECYADRGMRWWSGLEVADQAMVCAERALEIEPDLLEARLVHAMVYRLRGESEKLLKALDHIRRTDPDNAQAMEWTAWSYMSMGRPEEAVPVLEHLIRRGPASIVISGYLEDCLEVLGPFDYANRVSQQNLEHRIEFVRRHPEDALARVFLGISLIRDGQVEAGIAQTERAITIAPEDGRLRYNAACAFARAGLPDRALIELKEGTRNIPSYIADWPRHDPDLASLRDHPEFIRLFGSSASSKSPPSPSGADRPGASRGAPPRAPAQLDHDA
ncbi:MAG: protein kinase [Candidatus Eisenbacteria bacterium]|nr:protein kinase [Candidatus Eisenbacteria bacterium]